MMQGNTDRGKKKIAPVLVAVIVALCLLPIVGVMLVMMGVVAWEGGLLALPLIGLYAMAPTAVIIGVLAAMRQRLKEIDGGEEDEAKKY